MNNETKKGKLVPELRFPGFEGNWEVKRLGEIADNNDSRRRPVSKSDRKSGTYPYYGANGIQDYVEGFIFDGDFLLIGEDGSVINENDTPVLNWASGKIWVNNHAHVLSENNLACLKFIYYALGVVKISGLVTGIPPKLNQDNLNRIKIALPPSLPEQQKIAECLSGVDDLIQAEADQLQALKDHKKGLTQQLFPQEGETTPKLRFPGVKGEWEEKKLGDVFKRITRKNKENNKNVLTISAQYGLVSQIDFFNKSVAAADVTGYYLLEKGDFAYNKSSSSGNPVGVIKPLKMYDKGVVSTLYICFRCNNPASISFWEQYFNAGCLDAEIRTIAQEGARNHGLLNVPTSDFFTLTIIAPSLPEQQKIAECLSSLDEGIAAQQEKVEALKEHKKGLMQKLFPTIN